MSLETDHTTPFYSGSAVLPRRRSQKPKILLNWTPRQVACHSRTAREIAEVRPPAAARQGGGEYAAVAGGLVKVNMKELDSRTEEHGPELPGGGRSGRSTSKKVVCRGASTGDGAAAAMSTVLLSARERASAAHLLAIDPPHFAKWYVRIVADLLGEHNLLCTSHGVHRCMHRAIAGLFAFAPTAAFATGSSFPATGSSFPATGSGTCATGCVEKSTLFLPPSA
ncbi:abscisic acid 8'-hydroxylase 4-like [Hordeum vulgare]|nr:abscisic acid 8'-hydroxylase 4-like [Hordeum vulgare]KAI5001189.1 hypothetical protein ZWY2020_011148 [Hordeum vulgare]